MKKACLLFIVLMLVTACSKSTDNHSPLRDDLIGEWRNIYLNVTLYSYKNDSTKDKVVEADSTNWEDSLHIKPIRTFFKADSTYHSDYYNLNDSLIFSAKGNWSVEGDTLVMNQSSPAVTFRLKTAVTNNVAQFEGLLDFDEDGQRDDHYLGKQRRH